MRNIVVKHFSPSKRRVLCRQLGTHKARLCGSPNFVASSCRGARRRAGLSESVCLHQHPTRQEAEKNWDAFQADPEWQKVKAESEARGPLVNHIDRYFVNPTSFSALN